MAYFIESLNGTMSLVSGVRCQYTDDQGQKIVCHFYVFINSAEPFGPKLTTAFSPQLFSSSWPLYQADT